MTDPEGVEMNSSDKQFIGGGLRIASGSPAPRASRTGYVELPYTLPQDSTLFLLLRESTTAVWRTKLDWVAQHGGMALVNVHPDYLSFDRTVPKRREYPFVYYKSFLEYVSRTYQGVFWNATPREVAQFYARIATSTTAGEV